MKTHLLNWLGEELALYPQRAIHWVGASTLIAADPHFGKGASFRRMGVPVPDGTTSEGIARLDALLEHSQAERLIILGDFYHHRTGRSAKLTAELRNFRERRPGLSVILVRGNHDRHAGDPERALDIECVDEPWPDGPFAFAHVPRETKSRYVFSGHLHPGLKLRCVDGSKLRLPCFAFYQNRAILPAFGAFTGIHELRREPGARFFAAGGDEIVPLGETPARGPSRRR